MRPMMLVCIALIVGSVSGPVVAQDSEEQKAAPAAAASPADTAATAKQGDDAKKPKAAPANTSAADDMICTREKTTGSRMAKTVCIPRAEAEARTRESEDAIRDAKRTGQIGNASGG